MHKIITILFLVSISACNPPISTDSAKSNTSKMFAAQRPQYIFTPENVDAQTTHLNEIYAAMSQYYEGVEIAEAELLNEVFHPLWQMKDMDTPGELTLNVEDKPTFVNRVAAHGPYEGYAQERQITNIDVAYEKLAFVRVNKDPSKSATSFFLVKEGDKWLIIDKVWRNVKTDYSAISFGEIENVMNDYFDAISEPNIEQLEALLHPSWELISIGEELEKLDKSDYLEQISNGASVKPYHQNLLSMDLYHCGLAIVRSDEPTYARSTFFTLFRIADKWQIVSERRASGVTNSDPVATSD